MNREVVPALADAIERRRKELNLTPGAFIDATGISGPGLAPLRRGERRAYQERLIAAVTTTLRWTTDSIERLLRGEREVTWEQALADAERRLELVAGALDQSGGTEALYDYLATFAAVNDWRSRTGLPPAGHHPLAAPHVLARELMAHGMLEQDASSPELQAAWEAREAYVRRRTVKQQELPAVDDAAARIQFDEALGALGASIASLQDLADDRDRQLAETDRTVAELAAGRLRIDESIAALAAHLERIESRLDQAGIPQIQSGTTPAR